MGQLSAAEIAALGRHLYGPRWQTALARQLAVNPRTVRKWARGDLRVSKRCTDLIARLVRQRHTRWLVTKERDYRDLVSGFADPRFRAALLVIGA